MIAANPQEQWSETFDGWRYMAFANKDRLQVTAICTLPTCQNNASPSSKQGILDYIALNRKLVDNLDGKGEVQVVFRYPLLADEYNNFLQQSGLNVRLCIGHFGATDPAGPSIGGQCNVSNDANYEGVVDVLTDADATQVQQLQQDPRVFSVLVLRGIAIQKARAHLAATMPELAQVPVDDSHDEGGLYLEAEAVGLVGKQQKRVPLSSSNFISISVILQGKLLPHRGFLLLFAPG